jgi:hypothetical protein
MSGDHCFASFARQRGQGMAASTAPTTITKRTSPKMNCIVPSYALSILKPAALTRDR